MIKAVACVFPLLVPRTLCMYLWTCTLPARLEREKGDEEEAATEAEEEAQRGFLDDADDYLCTCCTWVARTVPGVETKSHPTITHHAREQEAPVEAIITMEQRDPRPRPPLFLSGCRRPNRDKGREGGVCPRKTERGKDRAGALTCPV